MLGITYLNHWWKSNFSKAIWVTISLNSPATSRMSFSFPKGFPAAFLDDFDAFPLELVGRTGCKVLASYRVSVRTQKDSQIRATFVSSPWSHKMVANREPGTKGQRYIGLKIATDETEASFTSGTITLM